MNSRVLHVVALLLCATLSASCHHEPNVVAADAGGGSVGPKAFDGQAFRTRSGTSSIVLISRDELEYTTNGTTLLCKYSEQDGALRVILTALGTQQVLYFRRVPGGIQSNDGVLFLDKAGLQELERQEQIRRQQEENERLARERQRAESERLAALEAQRQAEAQRAAEERAKREAPGKLRSLLSSHPTLVGTWAMGFGPAKVTFKVTSFDPGSGALTADADYPAYGYDRAHSNRVDGSVSGDTVQLTVFFEKEPTKPWMWMTLRYDGLSDQLVGKWGSPGKDDCSGCKVVLRRN